MQLNRSGLVLFGLAYSLLWVLALPILALSKRLRTGWRQRLGWDTPPSCDIWIQGASAGECALAATLLGSPEFTRLADSKPVRVLGTSCTSQGLDVLSAAAIHPQTTLHERFFPFDLPALMARTLRAVRPKVVVLLETEIWPGLLLACARLKIPVIVLNARMTPASLAGYLALRPVLARLAPDRVGAMAKDDARRFALIFDPDRVTVTGNIKFDRAADAHFRESDANPLRGLIPARVPFLVLGSVRAEEEKPVLELIHALRAARPDCIIGLFPRHMHRCPTWRERLAKAGIATRNRSCLDDPASPGTVLVWDRFGELAQAYALAHRAFVGGSLARLGGQNFLEPLAQGVLPAMGPHLDNFAWVGEEIFAGLAEREADPVRLAAILLAPAPPRAEVRVRFQAYVQARQGATAASFALLDPYLSQE